MATLNANSNVLTLYNDDHNVALSIKYKTITKLATVVRAPENKSSQDPYLGLTRHCATLSPDGRWYAVAAERNLIVWSTDDWRQKCVKILHRSASKITFTPSNQKILVADKTGDVYSYMVDDDNTSGGTLLLGHLSILLDILVTPDEKFVVTCDRDEKIRVTRFPNAHNIESFCLGHSAFVTKVLLLNDNTLLSGSGDGTLKFWHYVEGRCLASYCVENDINNESNHCIVTNVTTFERANELVVCVCVFKFEGILVYSCKKVSNYELKLVQKIDCCEPLDLVACGSVLWILKYSSSCLLKALSWDECAKRYGETVSPEVKDACNVVNDNYASIIGASVDLSVLHKKFSLKEKSIAKKVKLK